MNVFLIILGSVFALMTISENKIEYKKIFAECLIATIIGSVLLQFIQLLVG